MQINLLSIKINFSDRRVLVAAAVLVTIFLFILILALTGSSSEELKWAEVERGDFAIDLLESGEIRAVNSVDIKAPMEWRMDLQVIDLAPEGGMVEEGDFLVQFDTSTLEEELESAKDRLAGFEAELKRLDAEQTSQMSQMESDLQMATYSQEVAEIQLQQLKYESETRKEDARLALQKALVSLEEARTNIDAQKVINAAARQKVVLELEQSRLRVQEIEEKIGQLTLRAPIPGMVVYNEIGMFDSRHKVAIGDKPRPGQAVVSIPDLSQMEMVARVNEIDAALIDVGQSVNLRLDAFEESIFHGTVTRVAQLADKADWRSQIKDFEVTILIDESDQKLKPGMTSQGRIQLELIPDVVYAPIGAVFEQDGQSVVFSKRMYPNPSPVRLGRRNDRHIVIEEGLEGDDKIAWISPRDEVKPLGWFEEKQRRANEREQLLAHLDTMTVQGLGYDYDAHRGKSVLASADSAAGPMDVESILGEIRTMAKGGQPIELDPAKMKALRTMMQRGRPPTPGSATIAPGEQSQVQVKTFRVDQGVPEGNQGTTQYMITPESGGRLKLKAQPESTATGQQQMFKVMVPDSSTKTFPPKGVQIITKGRKQGDSEAPAEDTTEVKKRGPG